VGLCPRPRHKQAGYGYKKSAKIFVDFFSHNPDACVFFVFIAEAYIFLFSAAVFFIPLCFYPLLFNWIKGLPEKGNYRHRQTISALRARKDAAQMSIQAHLLGIYDPGH
jgi:hypothetical protein